MTARTCPLHDADDVLCHYPKPVPPVQQAMPADDYGLSWQVIGDVLLAGIATAVVLWFAFALLLSGGH